MAAVKSRDGRTAEAIRTAAVEAIARFGFQSASLRRIARTTGIRAPSLYHYFESKEQLLFELLEAPVSGMLDEHAAAAEGVSCPRERLRIFVRVHLGFHLRARLQVFIGNMELRSLSPRHGRVIRRLRDAYSCVLTRIVDDGVVAGQFAPCEARVTSFILLGMLSAPCQWFRPGGALSHEAFVELMAEMALRMIESDSVALPETSQAVSRACACGR